MAVTDASALLPGLRPASFRGVSFWIVDVSQPVGRRIITTWFPGTDLKTHDDTGIYDGPFKLQGLLVGDDYVAQAQALKRALQTPGPGMFVHPWFGPMRCVVSRPADISFASDELRVARIEAELDPSVGMAAAGTFGLALRALSALAPAALQLATTALSLRPQSAIAAASGLAAASSVLDALAIVAGALPRAAAFVLAGREALAAAALLPVQAGAAQASAAALMTAIAGVGGAWRTPPAPAVASASAAFQTSPDPRAGVTAMLAAAATVAARPRLLEGEALVLAAAELAIAAEVASSVFDLPFESRQEALGWLARADAALGGAAARLQGLAPSRPGLVSAPLGRIAEARGALSADINEAAGRLPSVRVLEIEAPVPAMLIAQELAGDDPAAVEPFLRDLVRRNRIRNPGAVSGSIEVLV
jgi:prophage DNA circulation protein